MATTPATTNTMEELFMHHLKDIYYAEKQILKDLPKMMKKAETQELMQAFEQHREETVHQVERLEQVFQLMGEKAKAEPCEAIQGLAEEGKELMGSFPKGPILDAGLIAAGQAIEHYEIARYGTLVEWAKQMGQKEVADLLNQTLQEEKKTDQLLSQLAKGNVNKKAA